MYFNEHGNNGIVDVTFDNFYADAAPPASVSAPATPQGMIGAPQVVNRTPASWSNFYTPAGGITFTATTLTTTNDHHHQCHPLNPQRRGCLLEPDHHPDYADHQCQRFLRPAGSQYSLAPNAVYDASIILQDSYGRRTTNVWTFDTFTDAYLAQYGNIECEDYDIGANGTPDNPLIFLSPPPGFQLTTTPGIPPLAPQRPWDTFSGSTSPITAGRRRGAWLCRP